MSKFRIVLLVAVLMCSIALVGFSATLEVFNDGETTTASRSTTASMGNKTVPVSTMDIQHDGASTASRSILISDGATWYAMRISETAVATSAAVATNTVYFYWDTTNNGIAMKYRIYDGDGKGLPLGGVDVYTTNAS